MSTYDINIQIVSMDQYKGMQFYSFGQASSLGVSGIQKLVNMFAKHLLTPIGTDPTNLTYGTLLPGLIGSNVSVNDAKDVIFQAVDATSTALQGFQSGLEIPDDERLGGATITDFLVIEDAPGVAAQIYITNVAGEGLPMLLPTLTVRTV